MTIIATGLMVGEALLAAEQLKNEGIAARVVNMATIKPIDRDIIVAAARETALSSPRRSTASTGAWAARWPRWSARPCRCR